MNSRRLLRKHLARERRIAAYAAALAAKLEADPLYAMNAVEAIKIEEQRRKAQSRASRERWDLKCNGRSY